MLIEDKLPLFCSELSTDFHS